MGIKLGGLADLQAHSQIKFHHQLTRTGTKVGFPLRSFIYITFESFEPSLNFAL